jgi:hypothetical protein
MQEPQSLGHHLLGKKIDAGRVTTWPSEASSKTKRDRVFANAKDDRNSCRCSFRRGRDCRIAGSDDGGHLSTDQIGH